MKDYKKIFNEMLEEAGIDEEDLTPFEDLEKMVFEEEGVSLLSEGDKLSISNNNNF